MAKRVATNRVTSPGGYQFSIVLYQVTDTEWEIAIYSGLIEVGRDSGLARHEIDRRMTANTNKARNGLYDPRR